MTCQFYEYAGAKKLPLQGMIQNKLWRKTIVCLLKADYKLSITKEIRKALSEWLY